MSATRAVRPRAAIVLVRHGETHGNAARILQRPEIPLSERGLEQAARLAQRLAELRVGRILTSDLARARMTAESVAQVTGAPLVQDPLLQERNFGDLRGTPYAELEVDPFAPGYVPPGGESWEQLHARADVAWERVAQLARSTEGHLVVVTHGLVCHSLVSRRFTLAPGMAAPAGFGNTSVTLVEPEAPWRVSLVNCTAHLGAAAVAPARQPAGVA